ncbi:MAG: hypothetical protein CLLPBCKN_003365 [Chroococcidiopsis cubana SAG 39.79]|uniref:hypothetical protein n=1 Tax=Chroococcidiopsis cubana TaxID=171392 RepID=UPI000D078AF9|nr:hypothetical protein [Chroococcidiopsis cubana]MDZ4873969.1 hypothetical protein [Chroococcidiopsis cubana SAG 39.79]PSB54400.1 hypothetical protein C7B79_34890 [Chroococcidiopsis cubana CCALA 043]
MFGKNLVNKQAFKIVFDNPLLVEALFPHEAARKLAISTHGKIIEELAEIAKTRNSKAFWSKLKTAGNDDTIVKVSYLFYRYVKEFEPDACEWFRKQVIAGKSVRNF